jgi:hypothetical protein
MQRESLGMGANNSSSGVGCKQGVGVCRQRKSIGRGENNSSSGVGM